MAAFDFPSSPSVNQTYTANGVTWKWNGTMWMRVSGAGYLEKIEEGDSKVEVDDSGSGNITATVDGTEALRVDSSGRILLGTTTPGHAIADNLTISDSGNCGITLISGTSNYGALYFGDSGGNNRGQVEYSHSADSLHFYTAAAERIRIKSDGRVGINQISPGAMLQVDYDEGSSEVGLRLRAYNASGSKTWQLSEVNGNAGVFSIRNATNSTEGLDIHGDGHVRVPSGDLRVGDNTDSNAGTKTISVGSVSSGSGGIGIFANPTNGNSWVQFGDGTSGSDQYRGYMNYQHADDSLRFGTAASEKLRITSGGNVGIGSVIPANVLDVQGTTHTKIHVGTTGTGHATGIQINHAKGNAALQEWQLQTDASADGNLKIRNATSSTDVMFFDADNNNIGINDTSPDANLSVGGSTAFIDVGAAGGNRGKIGYSSNNLYFGTSSSSGEFIFKNNVTSTDNPASSGTTRMRITGSGHVLRPTMAAAAVTLSADQNNLSTFGGSYQTLTLNSEGYDNANNFNTSNYRFTAPETGFYQVGCNVQLENGSRSASGNRWMYLYPIINGVAPGTSVGGNQADFDPADTYYYSWNWSSIMKLSQNDYVEWKYTGNLDSVNLRGQGQSVFYFYQVG